VAGDLGGGSGHGAKSNPQKAEAEAEAEGEGTQRTAAPPPAATRVGHSLRHTVWPTRVATGYGAAEERAWRGNAGPGGGGRAERGRNAGGTRGERPPRLVSSVFTERGLIREPADACSRGSFNRCSTGFIVDTSDRLHG
jgi:hypothetical protein